MALISITRALTEIKNIQDRMVKTYEDVVLGSYHHEGGKINGVDATTMKIKAESALQSFNDLFDRRVKLKAAIVASNAVTKVVIKDKEMTVAEAIELRSSYTSKLGLLSSARLQVQAAQRHVDNHNNARQKDLDGLLKANIDASGGNVNQASLDAISSSFKEQNFIKVFDPLNALTAYKDLENEINEFLVEVDFSLSESNTRTLIEV